MCGITGIYNFGKKNPVDRKLLKSMTDLISYRGPDDSGYYADGNIGLGHRRLSIIDLSKKGKQPMSNEEGTVFLTFNGEIYNFPALKEELEKKGHRFASNTDSEVIAHAYEEYGDECVKYLRGMFAFAIWDVKNKKLFLARDRVGKKPLFYYHDKERFVFASELKSLLLDSTIKRKISLVGISHYLSFGYVPSPLSIFDSIKKVRPGHSMTVQNGRISEKKYWDIRYEPEKRPVSYFKKRILKELEEAVRIRMISDVPLGAFLSGGIDSSSIVAMMSKLSEEPVKTFSIGFEEGRYNEVEYARKVAERFSTDHYEKIVKPDAVKLLPKLAWHYNEPFADQAAVPTYYLSEMTRKHVTVTLNGDGGDESFAGYERYLVSNLSKYSSIFPSQMRKMMAYSMQMLPISRFRTGRKIQRGFSALAVDPTQRYINIIGFFDQNGLKKEILTQKINGLNIDSNEILSRYYEQCNSKSMLNRLMYTDIRTYIPEDLMVKVDIASMAHALESRSPYLDHHFMAMAARIPPSHKLKGMTTKYILKKSLEPLLPKEIVYRKKQGFGMPIAEWFRNDLKGLTQDLLLGKRAKQRGYFRSDKIKQLIDHHISGRTDYGFKLWNLLMLEIWHRVYVDEGGDMPKKGLHSLV